MSEWDKREAAFEKSQEIEDQLRFKSLVRRNKLLGLWAAERLGMTSVAAEAYAKALAQTLVEKSDDEALALMLEAEFSTLDPPVSGHRIRREIQETGAIAAREIFEGR